MSSNPDILLCIPFGSVARQRESFHSDLDVAIAGQKSYRVDKKQTLIEELASVSGRPVDLIDL